MINTVVQKWHLCRLPKNEKQPSLGRARGEAGGFGNSPAPSSKVIDVSYESIGLVTEKCCLGCKGAHAVGGAGD